MTMILNSFIKLAHSEIKDPLQASKVCMARAAVRFVDTSNCEIGGMVYSGRVLKKIDDVLYKTAEAEVFNTFVTMLALEEMLSVIAMGQDPEGDLSFYESRADSSFMGQQLKGSFVKQ